MSGVLCVWANLPDDARAWYEDIFIPEMRTRNAIHALHCEVTESGFGGDPIEKLDAPWPLCAVYEIEDIKRATQDCYDKANHPSDTLLAGPLADARLDVRTYRELKRWQEDAWDGDISHIASIIIVEWRVPAEVHDEVFNFYTSFAAPGIFSSPDVLRFRIFEVDNVMALQGASLETKEKGLVHSYLTLIELDVEEWPWTTIIELAKNDTWAKYFEGQDVVQWNVSTYLVKKTYQKGEQDDSQQ